MPSSRRSSTSSTTSEKHLMTSSSLPIPTYAEATSSRSPSPYDDGTSENTGLLFDASSEHHISDAPSRPPPMTRPPGDHPFYPGPPTRRPSNYRAPTAESVTDSDASSFLEEFGSARQSAESLRREMQEMEVDDRDVGSGRRRRGGESRWAKRLSELGISIARPFRRWGSNRSRRGSSAPAAATPDEGRWKHFWGRVKYYGNLLALPYVPCGNTAVPVYRIFAVLIALTVVYAIIASDAFSWGATEGSRFIIPLDPRYVREIALQEVDRGSLQHYLHYFTSFDHMAGTEGDYVMSRYVEGQFRNFGLDQVEKDEYYVYLNYPKEGGREVSIEGTDWKAQLEEPAEGDGGNTLVFHGHSKAGTVKGPLVYANGGDRTDFDELEKMGVDVKGAVVLVRYGATQGDRALKIKAAEERGAVGCLIYSDQKSAEFPGYEWPENAVQRGGVSLMSWVVGDVLTPGWAATKEALRIKPEDSKGLVQIPSLPLSPHDASHLLLALKGKGKQVPDSWKGSVNGVSEWWTGSSKASPVVKLKNEQDEFTEKPIWNVLGQIHGTEDYKKRIIIGNHRDAWCLGATDPGSGSAVMLEVARIFGKLMESGYAPIRSIVFASWDAEEYNMIGSTEWVEENLDSLQHLALAYVNLDTAISGSTFSAAGSPIMQDMLLKVLAQMQDPVSNETLAAIWGDTPLPGLGSGSDYVPFQSHAGISSLDISFSGSGYPYHSCADTFSRMSTETDPGFFYHEALAKILVLIILELADTPVLPFNLSTYGTALHRYVDDLDSFVQNHTSKTEVDLMPLRIAIKEGTENMRKFDEMHAPWMEADDAGIPILTDTVSTIQRNDRTARMANFEKHLLNPAGVPGREWFRHVIFAPQAWSGYEPGYFPGIRDAVDRGNATMAKEQVQIAARLIQHAALKLLR